MKSINPNALRLLGAPLTACCLLATPALAQVSSVLTGTVTDAASRQPIADVVVTATSPNLQGEQVVVTDATGLYRIPQLPPGVYTLRFEKEAYRPFARGPIGLRADVTTRVNVELLPEAIKAETIVVVGRPPTVDVGSSSTGSTITSDFMRNIAVARPGGVGGSARSFESLAVTTPQAQTDVYGVSLSGATSPENSYQIDGLTVNNTAYGVNGAPMSVEFVDEVNVITGGYMPEYGRATGGTVSAITRSGGNEFHGSVYANLTPGILGGTPATVVNQASVLSSTSRLWNIGDFGANLGGYIVKDKLWFFVGIQPSFSRYQVERDVNAFDTDPTHHLLTDPTTGLIKTTPIPDATTHRFADDRMLGYIGKLTWLINPNHQLSLTVSGSPERSGSGSSLQFINGLPNTNVLGDFHSLSAINTNSATDVTLKLASSFLDKRVLLDVTGGWHHQEVQNLPVDGSRIGSGQGLSNIPQVRWSNAHSLLDFEPDPTPGELAVCEPAGTVKPVRCAVRRYLTGGPGQEIDSRLDSYQAKALLTFLANGLGHHVIKVGVDVQGTGYDHVKAYSGTTTYLENRNGTFTDYREYGYMKGPDDPVVQVKQHTITNSTLMGGFVQDSWSILDAVTLNAGLRYDSQFIYNNAGQLGMALPNEWSPRVGLVYDFTQQGRSKLYANYARYYEAVPLDLADRSLSGEPQIRAIHNNQPDPAGDPGCTPRTMTGPCSYTKNLLPRDPTQPNSYFGTYGGDVELIDPNLKPGNSVDEFVVGGEYEVLSNTRAGASYTRRRQVTIIEDMSRDNATTFFIGNPGEGIASTFPKAVRNYDAVTVYLTRAFSDLWLAQVSYTYTSLVGNYDGLFRPENQQIDPNINSTFDLVKLLANQYGPLSGDITHAIKIFAAKEFILNGMTSLTLGLSYDGHSMPPLLYLGANVADGYGPGQVYILPRGAGSRPPWINDVDGKLALNVRLAKDTLLTASIDVFNIFNWQRGTRFDQAYTVDNVGVLPITHGTLSDLDPSKGKFLRESLTPVQPGDLNRNFGNPLEYQPARSVRLGVKLTF